MIIGLPSTPPHHSAVGSAFSLPLCIPDTLCTLTFSRILQCPLLCLPEHRAWHITRRHPVKINSFSLNLSGLSARVSACCPNSDLPSTHSKHTIWVKGLKSHLSPEGCPSCCLLLTLPLDLGATAVSLSPGGHINSRDVWMFSSHLHTWIKVASLHKGRWRHKMAVVQGQVGI